MSVSEQGVREYEESYSELDLEKLEALEVLALDSSSVKTMVPELARVSKERTVSSASESTYEASSKKSRMSDWREHDLVRASWRHRWMVGSAS